MTIFNSSSDDAFGGQLFCAAVHKSRIGEAVAFCAPISPCFVMNSSPVGERQGA